MKILLIVLSVLALVLYVRTGDIGAFVLLLACILGVVLAW